jgi:arylsulfatase A-like enzyme
VLFVFSDMQRARQCLPDYYGMIESLDDEFGRLVTALEKAGVADDTIVVFSSDHGDMIGSQSLKAKRWPYEESARIQLLIRYPRSIKPGTVIADPIGSPDMYPTLAGLTFGHMRRQDQSPDFQKKLLAHNHSLSAHFGTYQNVCQYALSNSNGSTDASKSWSTGSTP